MYTLRCDVVYAANEIVRLQLGVEYVDLYLIHAPRYAQPDIPTAWAVMEKLKAQGLTKSIGVSNFEIRHLEELLREAKVTPAVNQVRRRVFFRRGAQLFFRSISIHTTTGSRSPC